MFIPILVITEGKTEPLFFADLNHKPTVKNMFSATKPPK